MSVIAQGRHGYVTMGSLDIPCFSWQMSQPRNLQSPVPVGSSYQTGFAEGLQSGRFVANIMVRKKATEVLSTDFWAMFLARTFSANFDDTSAITLVAADGKRVWTMANAKAESFALRVVKPQAVGLSVVFVSPAPGTSTNQTVTAYSKQIDSSPLLMGHEVTYTGFTGPVFGTELTWANNHVPNTGGHDGLKYLSSWDAGPMSCGFSVTTDIRATGTYSAFSDSAQVTMALAGAATRTFTLNSIVSNNPNDREVGLGQVFQTQNCLVLGATSNVLPLAVA